MTTMPGFSRSKMYGLACKSACPASTFCPFKTPVCVETWSFIMAPQEIHCCVT